VDCGLRVVLDVALVVDRGDVVVVDLVAVVVVSLTVVNCRLSPASRSTYTVGRKTSHFILDYEDYITLTFLGRFLYTFGTSDNR